MTDEPRLALLASPTDLAQQTAVDMRKAHTFAPFEEADIVVVLGGDGFMLQTLHQMLDTGRVLPAYGINRGTVGFLMNKPRPSRPILERVTRARGLTVNPLMMHATTNTGETCAFYAINEVSLLRETRQSARIEVTVNNKVRIPELTCDGVLVSTPAGSTAYNFSANGPILPLGSDLVALTPISPFRPRRWRGAVLPDHLPISFRVLEAVKRPVAVVADQKEIRDVSAVSVEIAREKTLCLLFDRGHSLDERIVAEQFVV